MAKRITFRMPKDGAEWSEVVTGSRHVYGTVNEKKDHIRAGIELNKKYKVSIKPFEGALELQTDNRGNYWLPNKTKRQSLFFCHGRIRELFGLPTFGIIPPIYIKEVPA